MFRVILEASQGMRERENLLVLPLNYKQKEASEGSHSLESYGSLRRCKYIEETQFSLKFDTRRNSKKKKEKKSHNVRKL